MKAVDRLTLFTTPELVAGNEEVQRLRRELEERLAKLEAIYTERVTLKN